MPQLDILAYPTQIFWLVLILLLTFLFTLKFFLPSILSMQKIRQAMVKRLNIAASILGKPLTHAKEKQAIFINKVLDALKINRWFKYNNKSNLDINKLVRSRFMKSNNRRQTWISLFFVWPKDEIILFLLFLISFTIVYLVFSSFITTFKQDREAILNSELQKVSIMEPLPQTTTNLGEVIEFYKSAFLTNEVVPSNYFINLTHVFNDTEPSAESFGEYEAPLRIIGITNRFPVNIFLSLKRLILNPYARPSGLNKAINKLIKGKKKTKLKKTALRNEKSRKRKKRRSLGIKSFFFRKPRRNSLFYKGKLIKLYRQTRPMYKSKRKFVKKKLKRRYTLRSKKKIVPSRLLKIARMFRERRIQQNRNKFRGA